MCPVQCVTYVSGRSFKNLQPFLRGIRHKLQPLHERGSNCIVLAARDLRRQRQKEFVYSFYRQELSKQCRPASVEKPLHPKPRAQQLQNRQWSDTASIRIQSMYLKGA
jgi:hypothetical protein